MGEQDNPLSIERHGRGLLHYLLQLLLLIALRTPSNTQEEKAGVAVDRYCHSFKCRFYRRSSIMSLIS